MQLDAAEMEGDLCVARQPCLLQHSGGSVHGYTGTKNQYSTPWPQLIRHLTTAESDFPFWEFAMESLRRFLE